MAQARAFCARADLSGSGFSDQIPGGTGRAPQSCSLCVAGSLDGPCICMLSAGGAVPRLCPFPALEEPLSGDSPEGGAVLQQCHRAATCWKPRSARTVRTYRPTLNSCAYDVRSSTFLRRQPGPTHFFLLLLCPILLRDSVVQAEGQTRAQWKGRDNQEASQPCNGVWKGCRRNPEGQGCILQAVPATGRSLAGTETKTTPTLTSTSRAAQKSTPVGHRRECKT